MAGRCRCASKLLTVRLHKGTKDKLQALLALAACSDDPAFVHAFVELMRRFPHGKLEDVVPDAQAAALAISLDTSMNSHDGGSYAPFRRQIERSLEILTRLEGRYLGPQ